MMAYYPVFLEMKERNCVVIGGGAIAERKVEGLVKAGANVTVIGSKITDGLKALLREGVIRHLAREYQASDRAGYDLVFVATDNADVNAVVFSEARSLRIWVNSTDDPAHCDFILPAVIRRGELTVAVSTGGVSPAVTRAIHQELDDYFTADYAQLVAVAAEVRRRLKAKSLRVSADSWNRAVQGDFRRLIKAERSEEAKNLLYEMLGAGS
jgi:siroheme synthase-like protein